MLLAAAWGCFLLVAFASHPQPDNLVTGFIVYALFGVDALEKISMATVIIIGVVQIGVCFLVGYVIGVFIETIQGARK